MGDDSKEERKHIPARYAQHGEMYKSSATTVIL